jgi:potassium/sodium efflux P-type ATPase
MTNSLVHDSPAGSLESTGRSSETTHPHALSGEQVLAVLGTDATSGLSSHDAADRLAHYGSNELPKAAQETILQLIWAQINSPLVWVLVASSVMAMLADPQDGLKNGLVILAVVIVNTIIGFVQEHRAGKAIQALSAMVPETATVIRDGVRSSVNAADLVPGDVVLLASGDRVPADGRLVQVRSMFIEEAALTGESVPAEKGLQAVEVQATIGDRVGMVFGGTLVTAGVATVVVTGTGSSTELGKISTLLDEATDLDTPLTQALSQIGKVLTIGIVVVALLMLAIGTWRDMAIADASFTDAFRGAVIFAIALAVGAIPEGLPAIVTIALAIGVQRMAARKAVIRKLPAVETLGSTTVICSDKTGTLTRNEMTVQGIWMPGAEYRISGVGYGLEGTVTANTGTANTGTANTGTESSEHLQALMEAGVLCNDSAIDRTATMPLLIGDPTEGALVVSAEKTGIDATALRSERPRLDIIPFESDHQYMATLHHNTTDGSTGSIAFIKGAPEAVLKRCNTGPDGNTIDRDAVHAAIDRYAAEGMRVLAFASLELPGTTIDMGDVDNGAVFLGLQAMIDPPRAEAVAAIAACHQAGVTVKMITGDHQGTATAIGKQLGLVGDGQFSRPSAISGVELAQLDDKTLRVVAEKHNVFARVAPEHKLRLVRALQANGNVVAMTGDGVNDTPALRQSDIGVAMGITGTAVSKEAADVVLADDNFASITAAVEEGRRVYDNLIKSLAFILPTNLGLALILMFAVAFFPFDPVTRELLVPMAPTQLLWINLVGAVALALPLAFEAKEADVMTRPPRDSKAPVLSRFVVGRTLLAAVSMTVGAIVMFTFEYNRSIDAGLAQDIAVADAQTIAVTTVIAFQVFYVLMCRSLRSSLRTIGLFSNPIVFAGIGSVIVLQALFIYWGPMNSVFNTAPLPTKDVALAVIAGSLIGPIIGMEKWLRNRPHRNR